MIVSDLIREKEEPLKLSYVTDAESASAAKRHFMELPHPKSPIISVSLSRLTQNDQHQASFHISICRTHALIALNEDLHSPKAPGVGELTHLWCDRLATAPTRHFTELLHLENQSRIFICPC